LCQQQLLLLHAVVEVLVSALLGSGGAVLMD
jgi:hypothetical protein